MPNLLEDKVSVITGGTRGIGKAIVEAFLREGASVCVTGRSKPGGFEEWAERNSLESRIEFLKFDVADSASVRKALLEMKKRFGRIDVLVNNAGVEYNELIGMIDEGHMHTTFETNVFGTILMTQYASRMMKARKAGSIVNISSGVGIKGNAGQSVYAASKGAVNSFTKSAAKELARDGIRVNAVAPGLTDTHMLDKTNEDAIAARIAGIPVGRLARPEEIAEACVFLASDRSSYITGQILAVDGCSIM